jgi:uncharacterized protein (UPF0210 family)
MKIRSITTFFHPKYSTNSLKDLAEEITQLKERCSEKGFEVQTIRLATPPYGEWLPFDLQSKIRIIRELEMQAHEVGFNYLSIGPAMPDDQASLEEIPAMLEATENVFITAVLADQLQGVSLPAVKRAAGIIHRATTITEDGFTNLRFAALANVPSGIPFFPAAYHSGKTPAFGIAMECADTAVSAFKRAGTLIEAKSTLLASLEKAAADIEGIINQNPGNLAIPFLGFDFSLAPFPLEQTSLGHALETLGIPRIGQSGSLAAAAFIADTLDQGTWLRSGFNGLMLPVLEDAILARRSIEQILTLKDLLLYSAVCGVGLDTVPLAGDISQDALYAILLDVAALSVRLHKPLTARLMPVPGLTAGDNTHFDFEFFANGAAMACETQPLENLMTGSENLQLQPRAQYAPAWKTKSR